MQFNADLISSIKKVIANKKFLLPLRFKVLFNKNFAKVGGNYYFYPVIKMLNFYGAKLTIIIDLITSVIKYLTIFNNY